MTNPGTEPPQVDYAVSTKDMPLAVEWYLDPVIERMKKIQTGFASAQGEVEQAHTSTAPGWFGGHGFSGALPSASSSFFNELKWQIELLATEEADLVASLQEYRQTLQAHLKWADDTENAITQNFVRIARDLDASGA